MKKIVYVFPGQGSQYVGMANEYSEHPIFEKANNALGFDLKTLCLEGPEDQLKLTQNTQPAIITHSLILLDELEKRNLKPDLVLGHSVGEYAALVAAGALSFEQAVVAVHNRGKYMQTAVPAGQGGMTAILRADDDVIKAACEKVSTNEEFCSVANYNSPGQVVISGHLGALERAVLYLKEQEVKFRAVNLPVSAPFHCSLMNNAADKLKTYLDGIDFKSLQTPYVANINAKEYPLGTSGDVIKQNLVTQVSASVLWTQSLMGLSKDSIVIEVGPGKVLKGLVKKTRPDIEVFSLDVDGFDFLENLK